MDSTGRLVHSLKGAKLFVLTFGIFCSYRALVSYKKSRYIRLICFWSPLTIMFFLALRSRVNSINHVKSIRLRANGTHVDILAHFPSQSAKNVSIATEITLHDRDKLEQLLSEDQTHLAQAELIPFKVKNSLYAIEMRGFCSNYDVLKAILNRKCIDTSKSVENGEQSRILDISEAPAKQH